MIDLCSRIVTPRPELIVFTGEGMIIASYSDGLLCNYTMNGRALKSKTVDDKLRVSPLCRVVNKTMHYYDVTNGMTTGDAEQQQQPVPGDGGRQGGGAGVERVGLQAPLHLPTVRCRHQGHRHIT